MCIGAAYDCRFDCKTDNPSVRYSISTYRTHIKGEKGYEVHHRETDVQVVLSGHEAVDGDLPVRCCARPGYFMVFFPGEAHEPGLTSDIQDSVKKAVFKITTGV